MITFAPHVLYDTQEVYCGAGTTHFFQEHKGRRQHFTNVQAAGALEWPFVITGFKLTVEGISRDDAYNVLVRLRIGEVQQWVWPLDSLTVTRDSPLERLEWDPTRDILGQKYDPQSILHSGLMDTARGWPSMMAANARVSQMATEWPWCLPMAMNFSFQIEATPMFKGRCPNMRAELHGLRAVEWA
jgi:hypothetical protein